MFDECPIVIFFFIQVATQADLNAQHIQGPPAWREGRRIVEWGVLVDELAACQKSCLN